MCLLGRLSKSGSGLGRLGSELGRLGKSGSGLGMLGSGLGRLCTSRYVSYVCVLGSYVS